MTEPLCLTVSLLVRAGSESEAVTTLEQLALHSRREPGNLAYNVHRGLENPRRFFIYEIYRNEAALEAHHQTPHFKQLAAGRLYDLVEERSSALYSPVSVA